MFSSTVALVLAFAAPSAFATVFTTSPVASTSWAAGQPVTVSWQDDGSAPTLASFGAASVGIYAGSVQQQTLLQLIVASVDVSTTSSVQFTPDATIGPNGSEYFLRFTSLNLKDTTNSQYPAEAFTAKFTMTGMTGTFNATVQAQIANAASASAVPSAASSAAASATSAAASSSHASSSAASKTGSSAASASSSAKAQNASSSGAGHVVVSSVLGAVGVAVAASTLFF
ncbi:hypothetical protein HETIRDRAFT_147901 [Heterobasidion irregulare TC 32-1]|uniref:Yeast cell wall synthesis Kre9/Knh1-like N-terminal domain-containing protein n=1 Tax=Heterobasidion irregulare (strain TC 32-1) TaxID=747525 RepID=W4JW97_HETIT|nr:uncharacterized protein HETIRDRAFT_147901 [Heterobasidion irregulare TC 32-1]ETW77355.1 hypothetical protein HETIRDRAFT_147901 [Heterobasidion irregulare TC 32-1]